MHDPLGSTAGEGPPRQPKELLHNAVGQARALLSKVWAWLLGLLGLGLGARRSASARVLLRPTTLFRVLDVCTDDCTGELASISVPASHAVRASITGLPVPCSLNAVIVSCPVMWPSLQPHVAAKHAICQINC